jgi:hypothetical protein
VRNSCVASIKLVAFTREAMKMTEAEATVRHAIRIAMASTSELTGLRAGPVVDPL